VPEKKAIEIQWLAGCSGRLGKSGNTGGSGFCPRFAGRLLLVFKHAFQST
jgi:hypothetical protein